MNKQLIEELNTLTANLRTVLHSTDLNALEDFYLRGAAKNLSNFLSDGITGLDKAIQALEAKQEAAVPDGCPPYAEIHVGEGRFALCDWRDWDTVKGFNWNLTTKNSSGCLYAQAWDGKDKATRTRISMHRLLMTPPEGMVVDHINGNGLDNRRSNLRLATTQENSFNQSGHGGSSRFKGVSFESSSGLWRAYITENGVRRYLGRHGSEIEAAKAYNMAAKEIFGEYAKPNILD